MIIDINQKKFSIGDKYSIFMNEQPSYSASAKLFRWFAEIDIFDRSEGRPRMTIKKKWAFLNKSYDITRWDNALLEFRTKSFWKRHYQCSLGSDMYDIYSHRGRKCSVYKNDVQIAWWDKEAIVWFEGDNYRITADKDSDYELIIAFCLMMDNAASDHSDNAVVIDLGNIGPQARKFDPAWQPK